MLQAAFPRIVQLRRRRGLSLILLMMESHLSAKEVVRQGILPASLAIVISGGNDQRQRASGWDGHRQQPRSGTSCSPGLAVHSSGSVPMG